MFATLDFKRCFTKYLKATADFRRSIAFFVLHSEHHKGNKASKATISRWIKQDYSLHL